MMLGVGEEVVAYAAARGGEPLPQVLEIDDPASENPLAREAPVAVAPRRRSLDHRLEPVDLARESPVKSARLYQRGERDRHQRGAQRLGDRRSIDEQQ